ncbi:glucosaminidase domain-containing protein [Cohnella boryungensis]|uniref:Glucosaminidase domain-containing protein n=1 Tax=Cohnella boryungensis TaxID=768479 RepID=A0ABV8S828_9BACL
MAKLSKPEFIAMLAPMAIRARKEGSPLLPSVRLAQNLLETGGVIHAWNNLGGIKVGSGKPNAYWRGQWVRKGTWEVENGVRTDTSALFRAYGSVYDFYKDQDLLLQLPRYDRVRKASTPYAQAEALRLCGYATDPQYGSKISALIQTYRLTQYDAQAAAPDPGPAAPAKDAPIPIPVRLNGVSLAEGRLIDSQTWVPARVVGEALGLKIGWKDKTVLANNKPLPTQVFDGKGYVPIRELAAIQPKAKVTWNKDANSVDLTTA